MQAVLYFVGLVLIYLASYAPAVNAPGGVREFFFALGSVVIVVKFELSQVPTPQIMTHQAVYSVVALSLSVVGGQLSANYATVWYVGLVVALIGAILAAYEELGGKIPPAPTPAPIPAAVPLKAQTYKPTSQHSAEVYQYGLSEE